MEIKEDSLAFKEKKGNKFSPVCAIREIFGTLKVSQERHE